jgi:tetratricopeptide (TPR) repeat protein
VPVRLLKSKLVAPPVGSSKMTFLPNSSAHPFQASYDEVSLASNYALAHRYKGSALSELKRYEEAVTAYEQAIQLDPIPVYNYQGKAHVLFKLRRYKEAIQVGKQAFTYIKQSTRYQR